MTEPMTPDTDKPTPSREDGEIYSPEATDGGTDWPTLLVSGAIIIAAVLFAYWVAS